MRVEYEMIAKAGFVLQVDDAWLPALWDRIGIQMGLDAFRAAASASKPSITRSPAFPRTASAIISAGAAGTARMPTISR